MARQAVINRENKRRNMVKKFAAKRAELKAICDDMKRSDEERMDARQKLQALPRDASPSRLRNRCSLTGRAAWRIPQVRHVPQQDPRNRHARRDSRRHQGQLVRSI
jgi:hypothetical protein